MSNVANAALVSVIIPTYNYARFIGEAVESVLAQTYGRFEIVVIDDGSSDNTREVVSRFADVRYVYQTNQGIAGARNAGVQLSQGDYLVFLDADDRLLPNALEAGARSLNEHPECAFVSGHWELFSNEKQLPPQLVVCFKDNYRDFLNFNYIGTMGQVMFRREIFATEPGFDTSVPGCDDAEIYMRLARDYPVYCHDQKVVQHRVHDSNTSGDRAMMLRSMDLIYRRHLELVNGDAELERLCRQGIEDCRRFLTKELKRRRRARIESNWLMKHALQVRDRIKAQLIFRRYLRERRRSHE